jgi:Fe(3+) dicitrate transport protein
LIEGMPYPNGPPTQVTAFNKAATYAVAPHVLYALTYGPLTVTPGMRAELMRMSYLDRATGYSIKHFSYALLPGVGTYYALTDEWGLLAGVYRGFSPPPPDTTAKKAEPEHSVNYEAGTRYTDGPLRAELIAFYNDYENLTDICGDSGGGCSSTYQDQQFSAGKARIYGVEAMAGHDVPVGKKLKLPLLVSYTFTRAYFGNTFSSQDPIWGNVQKGDVIPYVPLHQLRASAGVEAKPAGGALAFTYMASMSEGSTGTGSDRRDLFTDAQYLLDASVWAKVWGPFQLYATAQNLLDSVFIVSRRPFGARPNAPRWVHVGLKASY